MKIACYARKSNEKKTDSIENQLSIIKEYIMQRPDLQKAELCFFSDDGCSGIDTDRKAFQELLSGVRQRKYDVVIVKDLSRLSRNYLDVCTLADSIFPFMKVRLIAVAENYDSSCIDRNSIHLSAAFKSVLNEYYVLESSEKIKRSCYERIHRGEFIGKVPYGYFLSDKYTAVIHEEQAAVVRKIFEMYLDGNSILQIARYLNERSIPSRSGGKWSINSILYFLKNEQYTGKRIALDEVRNVKTKKCTPLPREQWYMIENGFPQIISKEMFQRVQEKLSVQKGHDTAPKHLMAYKLYCAGCGRSMKRDTYFYCRNGYITGGEACFKGGVKREFLYEAILKKVKEKIAAEISQNTNFSFSDIAIFENDIASLKEQKADLFEELFQERISEQEFKEKNALITDQIRTAEEAQEAARRMTALHVRHGSERPIDTLKRLYAETELTPEHMQFVKRINVFNPENFEILLQDESPLAVLCSNMKMYEEVDR